MKNLAAVLRGQCKYKEAKEMHREALRLSETVLGKEHPDTLTIMSNLANVHLKWIAVSCIRKFILTGETMSLAW